MRVVSAGDWLRLSARNHGQTDCFITENGRLTYSEVNSRVNRLANVLQAWEMAKGDRIGLFATDSSNYMEVLLASLKLGTVFVPLNFRLVETELHNLLKAAPPRCLFFSARYAGLVASAVSAIPEIQHLVCLDGDFPTGMDLHAHRYEDLVLQGTDREPEAVVGDDDLVGLCFTSGTTGLPKGVMHSQLMLKHVINQVVIERRLPDSACHYSSAPLFHVAGMMYVLGGIVRGHSSLILPAFDAGTTLRWLQSGEITGCFLVPTMIRALVDHPSATETRYEALHSIAYGAAPMLPALLRKSIDVFDCDFINMFGAGTEAGLQTVLTPADHKLALEGREYLLESIGRPAMGIDLRLVDDDMRDVAPGSVGEIVTRANAVMSGYMDQPDETAKVFVDGWFRGGDMAWEDGDGYLYLSGRKRDMIIRGGENIYPIEIEVVLEELPEVQEVAVVGRPDDYWGEIVRAHVVLHQDSKMTVAELRSHCVGRLAKYKVPAEFRIETELPKNASGKILKRELREWP